MQQQARELGKDKSHQEEWKNKGQYQQHSRVEFSTYQRMQRMENSKRSSRQQNQVKDSQPLATCDRFELQQNKNQLILQMQNSQRQIFEQQIQLLRCQIQQQNKRQVKLKDLINTLSEQIKYQRQTEEQNFKLSQLNEKLLDGLKQVKSRHSEEAKYYDNEIGKLKEEIHDKINQNERLRVEYQKRQLVYEQKVSMLESIIQKKCHRVNDLEKKIHQQSISKLKQTSSISPSRQFTQRNSTELGASTLRVSQIDHYDTENNMRASNLSMISKKSKASDLIKMNKSEMKNIMGVLIKSKRQLEKVHGDKSTQNYGYKQNKTMLN